MRDKALTVTGRSREVKEENLAIDNIQVRLFWTDGDTTSAATTAMRVERI